MSQRHTRDGAAWVRIAHVLGSPDLAPEVVGVITNGIGDAADLVESLAGADADGEPLFPLLRGPKIGPMWVRILAFPGGATIANLDVLPVSVDVQVIRATRRLGVTDAGGLSEGSARREVQRCWREEVEKSGTIGPPGLEDTCAALDPALWFWGKWGCSVCEQAGTQMPIGEPCVECNLEKLQCKDVGQLPDRSTRVRAASRTDDVRKLVHEHLNASMIMVPLDDPIDPEMPIAEALTYLDENEFDLAILASDEVRIVFRDRLRDVVESRGTDPVQRRWSSPRIDRLIEHTLELGEVARRLHNDDVPLLVVGRDGPEHIITRADFTRPAGLAGALAVIALLDAQLDELLQPYADRASTLIEQDRQDELGKFVERARRNSEEVSWLSYLYLSERLMLVRRLELGKELGLNLGDEQDHGLVTSVRNDIAHGRPPKSGSAVIEALSISERLLDALAARSVADSARR